MSRSRTRCSLDSCTGVGGERSLRFRGHTAESTVRLFVVLARSGKFVEFEELEICLHSRLHLAFSSLVRPSLGRFMQPLTLKLASALRYRGIVSDSCGSPRGCREGDWRVLIRACAETSGRRKRIWCPVMRICPAYAIKTGPSVRNPPSLTLKKNAGKQIQNTNQPKTIRYHTVVIVPSAPMVQTCLLPCRTLLSCPPAAVLVQSDSSTALARLSRTSRLN